MRQSDYAFNRWRAECELVFVPRQGSVYFTRFSRSRAHHFHGLFFIGDKVSYSAVSASPIYCRWAGVLLALGNKPNAGHEDVFVATLCREFLVVILALRPLGNKLRPAQAA